jgi:hypothetical protein
MIMVRLIKQGLALYTLTALHLIELEPEAHVSQAVAQNMLPYVDVSTSEHENRPYEEGGPTGRRPSCETSSLIRPNIIVPDIVLAHKNLLQERVERCALPWQLRAIIATGPWQSAIYCASKMGPSHAGKRRVIGQSLMFVLSQ